MNRGTLKPTDLIEKDENKEQQTDFGSHTRPPRFHRPTVRMDSKVTQIYGDQIADPALKNQPLRAHKVGENNGDVILRTEKEARVILVPKQEVTTYERTGQPTILTVFLVIVIMILGVLLFL